jgi:outer membrane protein insertion porin family
MSIIFPALVAFVFTVQAAAGSFQLGGVSVNGLKRFSQADVVKISGLTVGQPVSPRSLEEVANKLSGTGLFKTVSYRYTTADGKLTAILDVEEEPWTVPVVFDNFVWFSQQELVAAVRESVPGFDGTLPANDAVTDYVSQALQRLLDARKITGRVSGVGRVLMKTGGRQQLFVISGTASSLKICALKIPGASAVTEADLVAGSVIGTNYSRAFVDDLAAGTLRQEYRRRGYWAAELAFQRAELGQGCDGVTVFVSVKEGAVYAFDHVEWSGLVALSVAEVNKAFSMKSGDAAGLVHIEDGIRNVHNAYDKTGYILQEASFEPVLDDAVHRVTLRMKVNEGRQFRMGTLTFPDLQPADAERLVKKWKIPPGDIYDGSYLANYKMAEIAPVEGRGRIPRALRPEVALDSENLLVHVRFVVPK